MGLATYRPKSIDDLRLMADAIKATIAAAECRRREESSAIARDANRRLLQLERASNFRVSGLAYREISRRCGLPYSTVRASTDGIRDSAVRGHYKKAIRATRWPYCVTNAVDPLIASVNAVVPAGLPNEIREEVCQELALMLLEGKVTQQQMGAHVEQLIRTVKKAGILADLSLDYPYPGKTTPIKELV